MLVNKNKADIVKYFSFTISALIIFNLFFGSFSLFFSLFLFSALNASRNQACDRAEQKCCPHTDNDSGHYRTAFYLFCVAVFFI